MRWPYHYPQRILRTVHLPDRSFHSKSCPTADSASPYSADIILMSVVAVRYKLAVANKLTPPVEALG